MKKQYRRKPIVIEAEPWNGTIQEPYRIEKDEHGCFHIFTLEGWHELTEGDIIITGIKGETYPCKPDIFELTYESLDMTAYCRKLRGALEAVVDEMDESCEGFPTKAHKQAKQAIEESDNDESE